MQGTKFFPVAIVLAILLALSAGLSAAQGPAPQGQVGPQAMVGSAFTYQGQLQKDGTLVNDTCTMVFSLYDDASAGNMMNDPITQTVTVANGLFTVPLDFGSDVFTGDARWLEVAVQCTGDAGFNTLAPRQALTAAPYALSLQPGATISGTVGLGNVLSVINSTTALYPAVGVYGESDSGFYGYGVYGSAPASSGWAAGVYGETRSPNGAGVYAYGPSEGIYARASADSGETYGVYGRADSTAGRGIYGYASSTSGDARGVYGRSNSGEGAGVYGLATATNDRSYGVYGESLSSVYGAGVYGRASATSGAAYGVRGRSDSTGGLGVVGVATAASGATRGVYGDSASPDGIGALGYAYADSGYTSGVYGQADSTAGCGVCGWATAVTGDARGVYGRSSSNGGAGVRGYASATSGVTYGVLGITDSPDGWGVFATGDLGASGSKSAVVQTQGYGWRRLYSMESPDVLFEDVGTAQLVDGQASVTIDPIFAQTVNLEKPYQVFLTAQGEEFVLLLVAAQTGTSFTVRGATLDGRPATCAFHYRVIAKRLGYEDVRLAPAANPALAGEPMPPLTAPEGQP